jgi:hypothetical protein
MQGMCLAQRGCGVSASLMIRIGDRVFWNDPDDGICSCWGIVIWIDGERFVISTDAGGELEALEHELTT